MNGQEVYNSVGTGAAPVTLTAAFAGTVGSSCLCRYRKHLSLKGLYTPATTGAYLLILVEVSNDLLNNGPVTWVPLSTQVAGTAEVDDEVIGGTGMGSAGGIPIIVPGNKASTAAQAIPINYDMDFNATFVRVRCAEALASGTFGTTNIQITLMH